MKVNREYTYIHVNPSMKDLSAGGHVEVKIQGFSSGG